MLRSKQTNKIFLFLIWYFKQIFYSRQNTILILEISLKYLFIMIFPILNKNLRNQNYAIDAPITSKKEFNFFF